MTSNTFHIHIKYFTHKKYSNETELSKHVWHLIKESKTDFTIKWSTKKSIAYRGGSKRCNLCLDEKNSIMKEKTIESLLDKRSEIVSACQLQKYISGKQPKQRKECMLFNHPRVGENNQ